MSAHRTIRLNEISTRPPDEIAKSEARSQTKEHAKQLREEFLKLYADHSKSVLIILQGMDASGKDGAMKKVFKYCSPVNLSVQAFRKPTEEELDHDFLWRVHPHAPRKGTVKIFNRSHYEDILIQRVHRWIDADRVRFRMNAINAFEQLLERDNETLILKFYLHISAEQQKVELQERLEEEDKYWKHNPNDWKEAERFDEYMNCYQYILNHSVIPWHIIPVDKRWYRDYLMSDIILQNMKDLDLDYPPLPEEFRKGF